MLLTCRYCGATCKEGGPIFHESSCPVGERKRELEETRAYFLNFLNFSEGVLPDPKPLPPELQQLRDMAANDSQLTNEDKAAFEKKLQDEIFRRLLG